MKTECLCVCVDAHACIKKEVGGWLRYAYMYILAVDGCGTITSQF